jgi:drug/metabolite transporter (DMT)-like permease
MNNGNDGTTWLLTGLALVFFAANSVVCKAALGGGAIDPASFTIIRLASGAAILLPWVARAPRLKTGRAQGNWPSAAMLFVYAASFSYAYQTLETGTGALILFGAVQLTLTGSAFLSGERLGAMACAGTLAAFSGLVYLVLPGLTSPSASGFALMVLSGVAWGLYSVRGQAVQNPMIATGSNFLRSVCLAAPLFWVAWHKSQVSPTGVLLAVASGALASGMGYALWYTVIGQLKKAQAGVVQLFVPVMASLGGTLFLGEPLTMRLVIATLVILSGICLSVVGQSRSLRNAHKSKLI